MNKVIITADSTCDLSKELIEEYNIKIIPLHVIFGEESFRDGIDITPSELYSKVKETGKLPKTSAITPVEFYQFFKKYIDEGYDVFFTGISSSMSGTYQAAKLLSQTEFPEGRLQVLDSGNLSTGIGILLLKACKYRDEGKSLTEIISLVTPLVPRVKSQFVIPTLDYLYRGGRCNALSNFFGTMLHIKPLITVRDSSMHVAKKIVGTMKKSLTYMVNTCYLKDFQNGKVDNEFVFITDTVAEDYAKYITSLISDTLPSITHLYRTSAGCVISSHCGAGTIGILYLLKDEAADTDLDKNHE